MLLIMGKNMKYCLYFIYSYKISTLTYNDLLKLSNFPYQNLYQKFPRAGTVPNSDKKSLLQRPTSQICKYNATIMLIYLNVPVCI